MDIIVKNKQNIQSKKIKYKLDIIDSVVLDENYTMDNDSTENPKVYAQINNAKK